MGGGPNPSPSPNPNPSPNPSPSPNPDPNPNPNPNPNPHQVNAWEEALSARVQALRSVEEQLLWRSLALQARYRPLATAPFSYRPLATAP